jgi:hypothetical protein
MTQRNGEKNESEQSKGLFMPLFLGALAPPFFCGPCAILFSGPCAIFFLVALVPFFVWRRISFLCNLVYSSTTR